MKVVFIAFTIYLYTNSYYVKAKEFSSDTNQILEEIKPVFEENLRRAFRNEGVRTVDNNNQVYKYPLDDVLVIVEDNIIELHNLHLIWTPDFRINLMTINFTTLSLDVAFNLGDLKIEGEYEVNNRTLQKLLPVSHNGKIIFFLENVSCDGKIGIYIVQDSFVTANYDLKYETSEILMKVNYSGRENEVENEFTRSDIDTTLVKTFWNQLTETLTNLLDRQLGAVIVEFSVTELMADNDKELREFAKQHTVKANRLLDSLLCSAKDYLVAEGAWSIETPALEVIFKRKPSRAEQGTFQAHKGYIQDLSTLSRKHDMSYFEDGQKAVVYGTIQLRDFKHGYETYTSHYMQNEIKGNIRTTIYRNKIFLKIVILKKEEGCVPHLENVQVRTVGDIDMDVSGLASLSWLTSSIGSWVVGNLRNQALPMLEERIKIAFTHAIENTDCSVLMKDWF